MSTAMDMNAYNELKEIMGDILDELITTFLDTMPEQIDLLQTAVAGNDAEQVFATAHRIKSSSSSIGAMGLAEQAEALELRGRAGDVSDSAELLSGILSRYEEVATFLKSELSG